ncbi:hypothetical protein EC988_006156, partial [Linderina pennispora]
MDALNAYGSDSSDSEERAFARPVVRQYIVNTAPDVGGRELVGYIGHDQKELQYNVPYNVLSQPLAGPLDAAGSIGAPPTSGIDQQAVSEAAFRKQERMLRQQGVTVDPGASSPASIQRTKNNRALKRKGKGKAGVLDGDDAYLGPWAGYDNDTKGEAHGPTAEQLAEYEAQVADDQTASGGQPQRGPKRTLYTEGQKERTTFHSTSERDYQGRTYMHVPTDMVASDQTCFVPKRQVREWKAHVGGVSAIRFIPDSGHLLLSSGMDGLVKIFDTHRSRSLQRTFIGHSKAVRDINFAPDGQSFLSSSYDKYTKLWDTETGQCRQTFTTNKTPYVAKFYPEDPNVFLVGQGDKKIAQWDIRSNSVVQEYDQHLGAVNSITFVDSNRRFISSSDDKSMRVWEYGIPVVIKLIADPAMHSVPAVAAHPAGKWVAGQSMDNRIVVVNVGEKIKINRKKSFEGHLTAGYACQPAFSHDGKYVVSGDSEGGVWCWDWKSARVVDKWKAHDK